MPHISYPFAFTRIGADYWAAGGAAIAEENSHTAAYYNPAALRGDRLNIYAQFNARRETEYIADIKVDGQYILPSFISVSLPVNKFHFSVGYINAYDFRSFYRFEVTTPAQPQGTGETIDLTERLRLHSIFGSANYHFNDLLSAGAAFGLSYLKLHAELGHNAESNGDGYGSFFIGGLQFKPLPALRVGYTFKYFSNIEYDMDTEGLQYSGKPIKRKEIFPWMIETGLSYQPWNFLTLMAKIEFQKWRNEETDQYKSIQDFIDYSLGCKFIIWPPLTLSMGYYFMDHYYSERHDFYKQKFLSAGFRWQIMRNLAWETMINDSRFLSKKTQRSENDIFPERSFNQTIISTGLSVDL